MSWFWRTYGHYVGRMSARMGSPGPKSVFELGRVAEHA
jgi:hypothetical protein